MLSPGNPYVLPSVLVAAGAYLAVTLLTDASILLRVGVLAIGAGVVPVVLNRVLGGSSEELGDDHPEDPADEPPEA